MKNVPKPFVSAARIAVTFAAMFAAVAGAATAQATETVLYNFVGGTSDGAQPFAGLAIDSSGNLYGATYSGGSLGQGVVFELAAGATSDTILCNLPGSGNGAGPSGTPYLSPTGIIYGTATYGNIASSGSVSGNGTIYKCAPNPSGGGYNYTDLYNFVGGSSDGANPFAGVVLDSGGANLFGTTGAGGPSGDGTVYKFSVSGTTDQILHFFAGGTDGNYPYAGVIFDSTQSNLYGTTVLGGSSDNGILYKKSVSGGTPTIVHNFTTSSNGILPRAGLASDSTGTVFYGTTMIGGSAASNGVVFSTVPGTTIYSVLHAFAGGSTDGAQPWSNLIRDSSGNLYGTTTSGGASGYGVVFELKAGSSGYTYSVLYSFAGGTNDGANPYAGLTFDSSGNLYGTTANGGASGKGIIFKIIP